MTLQTITTGRDLRPARPGGLRATEDRTMLYITINDDPDYWGDCSECGDGFDPVTEGDRIATAAESAGIEVIRNEHSPAMLVDHDDEQVNWWDTWCSSGYEWSDDEWADWMAQQND